MLNGANSLCTSVNLLLGIANDFRKIHSLPCIPHIQYIVKYNSNLGKNLNNKKINHIAYNIPILLVIIDVVYDSKISRE